MGGVETLRTSSRSISTITIHGLPVCQADGRDLTSGPEFRV